MAFFDLGDLVVSGLNHPHRDPLSPNSVRLQMAVLWFAWSHPVLRSLKFFQRGGQKGGLPLLLPPHLCAVVGAARPKPSLLAAGAFGGNIIAISPPTVSFYYERQPLLR